MSHILVVSRPYIHVTYSRPGAIHTHDQAHARSHDQAHACTSWRSCSWAVTAWCSCSWSWAADGRFVCHIQTRPGRASCARQANELAQLVRSWCAAGVQLAQKPPIWGTHNTQLSKECDGHGRFFHYPRTTQACARRRPGRGRGRPWAVFGWYGRFFSAHLNCTPAAVSRVRLSKKAVLQTEKYHPKTAHQLPIPSPPGRARKPPSCATRRPAARPGAAAAARALVSLSQNDLHLSPAATAAQPGAH